jgi:hypothetical protein
VNSQKRTDIWESLLDAEMNEIYWSDEAQRYGSRDRWLAATAAIVSSGTVLALFASFPMVGKGMGTVASIVTIIHATFYHTGRLKQVASLAARWKEIAIEYRFLWSNTKGKEVAESKICNDYEAISRREKSIDESAFKAHQRRLKQAQEQVFISRGLKHERQGSKGTTAATTATTATTNTTATP